MGLPIVHFEIGCRNRPQTEAFYARLFDWKIKESVIDTGVGGSINGHFMSLGQPSDNYIMIYVQVDDLAAYMAKARALGGKVLVAPVELASGSYAWIVDPDGNTIGLWRPWTSSELAVQ